MREDAETEIGRSSREGARLGRWFDMYANSSQMAAAAFRNLSETLPREATGGQVADLLEALRKVVPFEHMGASGGSVVGIHEGNLLTTTIPRRYVEEYLAERAYRTDPVVFALARAEHFATPAEIAQAGASDRMYARTLSIRASHGIALPLAVRIMREGHYAGSVSFIRRGGFSSIETKLLVAFAPLLHAALARLPETPRRALTQRERECLRWAADGKTAWEIAAILNVSEHTVVAHLTSAARKLGAANRLHAVASALRSGLID